MTTSVNMKDGPRQIAWEDVPATFQDAVRVAQGLGYQYLWIDSLCIIQDTDDLFVQLQKMPDIYQNAVLVISADSAVNTISGFLAQPRHPSKKIPVHPTRGLPTRYRKVSNGLELLLNDLSCIGVSHRFFVPDGDNGMIRVPNSEIMVARNVVFERAWCFQERLLASRILHFTADEIVWECRTESDCECGWMKNATNAIVGQKCRTLKETFNRPRTPNPFISKSARESNWEWWEQIVATYSACKLTKDTDRLLAISAVATQLERRLEPKELEQEFYFAGLWGSAFPECLLWRSANEPSEYDTQTSAAVLDHAFRPPPRVRSAAVTETALRQSRAPTHSRPVDFVAPSWSWASVKGPIKFLPRTSQFSISTILDVQVQPRSGHTIFGQLESASLLLRAPAVKAKLELYHPKVQLVRELSALEAWVVINAECQGLVFLDVCKEPESLGSSGERDVVCVFLDFPIYFQGRPRYHALVLERSTFPSGQRHQRWKYARVYHRLGIAEFFLSETQRAGLEKSSPHGKNDKLVARPPTFITEIGAVPQVMQII
ncbi:hypothetical protein AYO22_07820 [Fonsecaea multimorphosa]|nr:hypothetical protein AYO22_07820 [Fonsecaea multimorphosa]